MFLGLRVLCGCCQRWLADALQWELLCITGTAGFSVAPVDNANVGQKSSLLGAASITRM